MESFSYTILCHHGIKGQKWGIRRFQNQDGSLTEAGKKRYNEISYDPDGKSRSANFSKRIESKYPLSGDVQKKWYDVLNSEYESDYSKYNGPYKKEWEESVKRGEEIQKQFRTLWEKTYQEVAIEMTTPKSRLQKFINQFKIIDDISAKVKSEAHNRYPKTKEFATLKKENELNHLKIREYERKMAGTWKDKTLRDILKTVPESEKDDVYKYFRFYNWTYD